MDSVELYGQTLTAADLGPACSRALEGHAMVPMALYPMSGAQWLRDLVDAVEGQPLQTALDQALTALLATETGDALVELASVLEMRPGHVSAQALAAALRRASDAPERARRSLARAVSAGLFSGQLAYDPAFRDLAHDVPVRNWLGSAYLLFDHAWTLAQLPGWFIGDLDADDDLLVCMSSWLSRGELRALLREAQAAAWPAVALEPLAEFVGRVADMPQFARGGDAVRWA